MGLLDYFRKERKEQQEWRLVHEIGPFAVYILQKNYRREKVKGDLYIYMFESSTGNRCIQGRCTIPDLSQAQIDKAIKSESIYMTRIYRWLMGRADPEINRYDDVEQEEVMHYLKGTIEEKLDVTTTTDK